MSEHISHFVREHIPHPIKRYKEKRARRATQEPNRGRRALLKGTTAVAAGLAVGPFIDVYRSHHPHEIDTENLAKECPPKVKEASAAILDIGIKRHRGDTIAQSGFIVQSEAFPKGLVITTGSGLSKQWSNLESISAAGQNPDGSKKTLKRHAERKTVNEKGNILAIEIDQDVLPPITLRQDTTDIPVGQELFAMDYGPTNNKPRYPGANDPDMRPPAIYGGPVVGYTQEGYGICLTVINYGEGAPETEVGPGSKGGAIVDTNGELVGQISGVYKGTGETIEKNFDLKLIGLDDEAGDKQYNLTLYKKITPDDIKEFEDSFKLWEHPNIAYSPAEDCDPQADLKNLEGVNAHGEKVALNKNLLKIIQATADHSPIKITCITTGHTYRRSDTGDISDHSLGDSFDMGGVFSTPEIEKANVTWLHDNRHTLPIKEVLSPWDLPEEGDADIAFGTNEEHKNHVHVAAQPDDK